MLAVGLGVLLTAAAIVAGRAALRDQGGAARGRPGQDDRVAAQPLPGAPQQARTGLRLLVASDPTPVVLVVDTGAIQPVTGLPAADDRRTHVESVGEHAVVVSRRDCRGSGCDADSVVYLVQHGSTMATRLAAAADVEFSRAGAFRRLPRVVDGVAASNLVLSTVRPGKLIALTDLGSGASHPLPWPSRLDDHVMGLIDGHPEGRFASVAFYPARSGAEQTLDVWLLDLTTRRWQQLPDMPLRLAPSKPQLRWTADGRLVLLAGLPDEPASVVAVWRPGQPRIAARRVQLPNLERRSGYRFAIW